jgi:hypothetical protein
VTWRDILRAVAWMALIGFLLTALITFIWTTVQGIMG